MAQGDPVNGPSLEMAFQAARAKDFKLFFSFDYAGNGPWSKADVISLLKKYSGDKAYFIYGTKPLVSTFEGPGQAGDWKDIKAQTGCVFIPDYSSLGAKVALDQSRDVVDGLFNWAAWPVGPSDTNLYVDASYQLFLDMANKTYYMAPVSPWFYTNMPGYEKNWLWRGDDLWFERWNQIINMESPPDFVEIISWNDFGESHYIGPLNDKAYVAFDTGDAPSNYVKDMPHDGWRALLPYLIDMYKYGISTIDQETISVWYRLGSAKACQNGGTIGNTASHLQIEYDPTDLLQDKIFFSVLLGSDADVSVTVGGRPIPAQWKYKPYGNVGIYHGNAQFTGNTGQVVVTISRSGNTVLQLAGLKPIGDGCQGGIANYNAFTQSAGGQTVSVSPKDNLSKLKCIQGFGMAGFEEICQFTCSRGYCPIGTCTCIKKGVAPNRPDNATHYDGFPANGDPNWGGLCSFACDWGYCPRDKCSATQMPVNIPKVSPFTPKTCTSGVDRTSKTGWLCSFTCKYGYCPMHLCACTSTGDLNDLPAMSNNTDSYALDDSDMDMRGLCRFSCKFGYCPSDICFDGSNAEVDPNAGDDGSDNSGPIMVDDPNQSYNYSDVRLSTAMDCVIFNPPDSKTTMGMCEKACKDEVQKAKDAGLTGNWGCVGYWPDSNGKIPWQHDKGTSYDVAPGKCFCNSPTVTELAESFVEALPAIAQVTSLSPIILSSCGILTCLYRSDVSC
jgi:hypothetical protein